MSLSKEQIASIIYFWDEKKDITLHPDYNRALKFEIKKEYPELDYAVKSIEQSISLMSTVIDMLRVEIE